MQAIYVERVPLVDVLLDQKKPIIKLIKQILAIKAADLKGDVTTLETETDARVAHLYELTEEEYALILNETKPPDPFRVAALNFYRDIERGVLK